MRKLLATLFILSAGCTHADVGISGPCLTTPDGVYYCHKYQKYEGTWRHRKTVDTFIYNDGSVHTIEYPRTIIDPLYGECTKGRGGLLHFIPVKFLQENTDFSEAGVLTGYEYRSDGCVNHYEYDEVLAYYFPKDDSGIFVYDMRKADEYTARFEVDGGTMTLTRVWSNTMTRVTIYDKVSTYPTNCREGSRLGTCYNSDYEIVGTCIEEALCGVLLQSLDMEYGDWIE